MSPKSARLGLKGWSLSGQFGFRACRSPVSGRGRTGQATPGGRSTPGRLPRSYSNLALPGGQTAPSVPPGGDSPTWAVRKPTEDERSRVYTLQARRCPVAIAAATSDQPRPDTPTAPHRARSLRRPSATKVPATHAEPVKYRCQALPWRAERLAIGRGLPRVGCIRYGRDRLPEQGV